MFLTFIDQSVIDFIGNNPGLEPADFFHPLNRQQIPGGIGGRVDKYGFGLVRNLIFYGFQSELKTILLVNLYAGRLCFHETNKVGITGVVRVGDDHLIAPVQQHRKKQQHRRRGPGCNQNLIRFDANSVQILIISADGFPELDQSETVGVMGVPFLKCLAGGVFYAHRRIEIGLPHFEMDDVNTSAFHLMRLFEDVHHDERGNVSDPFGKHAAGCSSSESACFDRRFTRVPKWVKQKRRPHQSGHSLSTTGVEISTI